MRRYDITHFDVLENAQNNEITLKNLSEAYVEQIDSCQAWVIYTPRYIILQSYNTLVAMIDTVSNKIYCSGTYSHTTINHIGRFARRYGLNYYDFKEAIK